MWKLPPWLLSLFSILLLFGLGNLALVGAQLLWHRSDQKRLDSLKLEITAAQASLQQQETAMHRAAQELTNLRMWIEGEDLLDLEREQLITRYNAKLARATSAFAVYSATVDTTNAKIDEANALSKKIGGIWHLIPAPRGKTQH